MAQHFQGIPNHLNANLGITADQAQGDPNLSIEYLANQMLGYLGHQAAFMQAHLGQNAPPADVIQDYAQSLTDMVDAMQRVRTAYGDRRQRVVAEERIPIFSEIHAFGNVNDLPAVRDYRVETFSGLPSDKIDCLSFIRRLLQQCQVANLTEQACIQMLTRHTLGPAANIVNFAVRDNADLEEVVRRLEIRFADLMHPELARAKCEKIVRAAGETLAAVGLRIRIAARMAGRDERGNRLPEEETRIARRTFRSILPAEIQLDLDSQESLRLRSGQGPWPYETYVERATELESRLDIYKKRDKVSGNDSSSKSKSGSNASRNSGSVLFVKSGRTSDSDSESDSSEESGNGKVLVTTSENTARNAETTPVLSDELASQMVTFFNDQLARAQKEQVDLQRRYRSLERRSRDGRYRNRSNSATSSRYPSKNSEHRNRSNQRNSNSSSSSRRDKDRDRYHRSQSKESKHRSPSPHVNNMIRPSDVNCSSDECIKCGRGGHFFRDKDKCHLYLFPLVPEACSNCKKGGHLPHHCSNPPAKDGKVDRGKVLALAKEVAKYTKEQEKSKSKNSKN
jgi:hypothetical protein